MAGKSLVDFKKRLSRALLELPGVSGVGLPAPGLTVYLEDDTPALRAQVTEVIAGLQLPVEVHLVTTGALRARVPVRRT